MKTQNTNDELCAHVHEGFWTDTWVKYNQNYFYLYPFLENSVTYRSDPSTDFHA